MRIFLPCLILAALVPAVPAQAHSLQAPPDRFSAKLLACDEEAHSAVFRGSMSVFKGAVGLEMLFRLQVKGSDEQRFASAGAPAPFDQWRAAEMGKRRYVYDQTVANLPVGSAYRALVRFRWRNAAGEIVARDTHRTKQCVQPDTRPNFHILSIRAGERYPDGTREYVVSYLNDGESDVDGSFVINLSVTNTLQLATTDADLAAGDRNDAVFTLPACPAGSELVAVVDATGLIDESDEADNSLTVPCPT